MGCVTGKGIASLVRERFGIRLVHAGMRRSLQHCCYLLRIQVLRSVWSSFWHPDVRLGAYQCSDGVAS